AADGGIVRVADVLPHGAGPDGGGRVSAEEDDGHPSNRDPGGGEGVELDVLSRPRGQVGEVRRGKRLALELDLDRDRRVPGVGDEGGEAGALGVRDDVRVDGIVVAADGALVLLGAVAGLDAAVHAAALVGRAGRDDHVVAVEDLVQVGRAVGAAGGV